ncbi:putative DsbA family dithiol-disulfide isomerase [Nocardia pseudobrasiliensis]|uniref:Putative DsbA family dithiol-disulfide isomerase n=2 Tax=Nocardia pseudobrasiliensis TaxID=45979 RepID=A0A370ICM0_9NOCA|nr:putative DsbA family dithiol-disulfide isomerase [Nocardia pseudobrasiliensis]
MIIEFFADTACPWAMIAHRRLATALAEFPHRDNVHVVWRSIELDPSAGDTPLPVADFLAAHRGITDTEARRLLDEVTRVAAEEGLRYDLARARHTRTFTSHRLIHFAAEHGRAEAMSQRLLSGYLERGESLADEATLLAIATGIGLDTEHTRRVLADDHYGEQVYADEADAYRRGITHGPFLVFDHAHGLSAHGDHGGSDPTLIATALHTAWQAHTTRTP